MRTGYVPVVEFGGPNGDQVTHRMVHWTKAAYIGTVRGARRENLHESEPDPEAVRERMRAELPSIVRRAPRERYRVMLERIAADALASYRSHGRVLWPRSLELELKALGWADGDPKLKDLGGIEAVRAQVEALTRRYIETGARRQRETDARKSTLDWHGHTTA